MTLTEWMERSIEEAGLSYREARTRQSRLRCYVAPTVGHLPLDQVGPDDVRRAMAAAPTPAQARRVWQDLRWALGRAVEAGVLPANPAAQVRPPRVEEYRPRVLMTREEVDRFLRAARRHPRGLLFEFALLTGVRQGELLGLRWEDVDLDRGVVFIRRDLERVPGGWRLGTPKSRSSARAVVLPPSLVEALRQHRAQARGEFVFAARNGQPLWSQNVTGRDLRAICRAAGLPRLRFHDLRHSHVTWLMAQGVSPRVIAARVGHARASFTMDRYAWAATDMQAVAAQAAEALACGAGTR